MKEISDKKLDFVVKHYEEGMFDTEKVIKHLHASEHSTPRFRWLTTAAAVAASVVIVFAAGYGITSAVRHSTEKSVPDAVHTILNPEVASTHVFVYDNAPLGDVLAELSDYFGCTLEAEPTRKCLTATFPDDDLDLILSIIESVLNVDITVKK